MNLGKIALYGRLAYAGYTLFQSGKETYEDYKNIIDQFEYKFLNVHDINLKEKQIDAKVDLRLINNSKVDLSLSAAGAVTLEQINFYLKDGTYLGKASPRLKSLSIPAKGYVDFKNIPLKISFEQLSGLISNALSVIQNINNLDTEFVLTVLGKDISI